MDLIGFNSNPPYYTFASPIPFDPFYYWEFSVNQTPLQTGIDHTILNAGDIISFKLQAYDEERQASSAVKEKQTKAITKVRL